MKYDAVIQNNVVKLCILALKDVSDDHVKLKKQTAEQYQICNRLCYKTGTCYVYMCLLKII